MLGGKESRADVSGTWRSKEGHSLALGTDTAILESFDTVMMTEKIQAKRSTRSAMQGLTGDSWVNCGRGRRRAGLGFLACRLMLQRYNHTTRASCRIYPQHHNGNQNRTGNRAVFEMPACPATANSSAAL
jgi:hypothetical protein